MLRFFKRQLKNNKMQRIKYFLKNMFEIQLQFSTLRFCFIKLREIEKKKIYSNCVAKTQKL